MKVGKMDVVFLLLVGGLLATWDFGGNAKVYYELHGKLRKQREMVPEVLLNPLGVVSSVQPRRKENKGAEGAEDGEAGDDGDDGDEEAIPEDQEEGGAERGVSAEDELDGQDEGKRKAQEEARKMILEDTLLTIKLEDMRKSMEKGLLPAETRFSFEVAMAPAALTSTESMDDEEREFAEKLQSKMDEWSATLDRIDRAVNDKSLPEDGPVDSDEWKANVEEQVQWQDAELARLRDAIRVDEKSTLSGREVKDADFYDVEVNQPLEDGYDEEAAAGGGGEAGADAGKAIKTVKAKRKSAGSDDSAPTVSLEGDVADYADMVRQTEREISFWAHTSQKSILVFGNPAYVHRDVDTYSRAFTKVGFAVERRKKEGPMPGKTLQMNEHPVLICLALKNDDCFSSSGHSKIKRYQRINRITGLRAVLWSKDSFCKTISSGTKGEAMFTDYTFHCWIFPNEWTSAREYAQAHEDASFIVKPLTMGGGKGITVVDGEKGLSKIRFKTHIVQNYLGNPHLIHMHKWDIRTYVLVTSTVPMRAYVYSRGLIRFASSAYDPNAKKGGKRSQFLTNTSVNKKYVKQNVTDITWSFNDLKSHFDKTTPGAYEALISKMQSAISIVFLSAEQEWRRYYSSKGESCHTCFQIMGVDLIVDSDMNPRVIEVNGQPNMKLSKDKRDHYSITKMSMMEDMVHMIFKEESVADELLVALQGVDDTVLRTLTDSDWEYLLEYMKERKHRGKWMKVYPNREDAQLHSAFLEQQKRNPPRLALHDVLMHLEEVTNDMVAT